jgi:hypothetical protein
MPTTEIRTLTDFQLILKETNTTGKTVVYIYQEGTPNHYELKHTFDLISRECPYSKFYTLNIEKVESADDSDEFVNNLNITSSPVFLVKGPERTIVLDSSTRMGLVNTMKRAGVLDENVDIPIV